MVNSSRIAETTPAPAEEGLLPIRIDAVPIEALTDFDLYFRPDPSQPFVLYSRRNEHFDEEARRRLEENRIERLYIAESRERDFRRCVGYNLSAIIDDEAISIEERSELLHASGQAIVQDILDDCHSDEAVTRAKEMVRNTVRFLHTDKSVFQHVVRALTVDYQVYSHSVNVAIYSVALAQRAGYEAAATLREVANGALLHDTGKSYLDPAIIAKPGPLTLVEWEAMKEHPVAGYRILEGMGRLGEIALDIVLHHHEKVCGGGYPDDLEGRAISPFVRIVTIADVFDALTTKRPFQEAKSTFDALGMMNGRMRNELDPALLRLFVQMMGKLRK